MSNWHSDTMKKMKRLSERQLRFIIDDCKKAIEVGGGFNPKCGQYADEIHYAYAELDARNKAWEEKEYRKQKRYERAMRNGLFN